MATKAEIQAAINQIVTNANYRANSMRPLLTDMLDFSSAGQTLVFPDLVANNTTMADTTLVLEYGVNVIVTSTSTNYACRLPIPTTGKRVIVVNKSNMVINLYPSMAGGQINNYAIDAPAIIPPDGKAYDFICIENPLPGAWVWSPPAIGQWDSGEISYNSTSSTKWLQSNGVNSIEKSGLSTTGAIGVDPLNTPFASDSLGCTFNPSNMWNSVVKVKVYTNISSALDFGIFPPVAALFAGTGQNNYEAGTFTHVNTTLLLTGSYTFPNTKSINNIIAGTVPPAGITANIGDEGTFWTEYEFTGGNVLGYSHIGNKFISSDGVNDFWISNFLSINFRAGQVLDGIKFRFFIEYT